MTEAGDPTPASEEPQRVIVDADACPVKDEIYKVAKRYDARVILVSNSWMRTPNETWIELVEVGNLFDEADDWIVEQAGVGDIVITADVPLAARCIDKGALVVGHRGKQFTEDSIGESLGMRNLFDHLRGVGEMTKGPPPFEPRDRSQFLQTLDRVFHLAKKKRRSR